MVADKNMAVSLCGITLRNPVVPASGTFGFGLELADSFDLNVLGGISLKGTTREARFGNPTPRIAECSAGMINSVGLQNPGIEALVSGKAPALRRIIVSYLLNLALCLIIFYKQLLVILHLI